MKVYCFLILIWVLLPGDTVAETRLCNLRETKFGAVCVCTADYCDFLENPVPGAADEYVLVSSSKAGLRFSTTSGRFNTNRTVIRDYIRTKRKRNVEEGSEFEPISLVVPEGRTFLQFLYSVNGGVKSAKIVKLDLNRGRISQKIIGFGGALTGSVSYILQQLQQELQDQIYKIYFHKDGIGYNMLRMSIGGSDFDLEPWAYNELPVNDRLLTNFTQLDPRDDSKVQQLKRIKALTGLEDLKIIATAWSPPKWMKSNNDWTGISYLKPEYYQTWANYHLKFLELMASKNIPIWAISTGNEPLNGVFFSLFIHFMSLGWTPNEQAIWLNDNLGRTIKNSPYKDVLIFSNDDQRYTYPKWLHAMLSTRSSALDYLDGLATHWYWDEIIDPSHIDETHKEFQNKWLLNTESSIGDKPWEIHGPTLGSWERGEQYMRGYLQNFQHSYNGWIDWNLVLDEQGGPNYVHNYVDAAVIVNTTSRNEFYKQPIYYAIGHFSKFVPNGSQRIETTVSDVDINAVGFKRPDGRIVTVIYNSGPAPIDVALSDSVRGSILINIPARSMHTIIYN